MEHKGYWSIVQEHRLSRRRALVASGVAALGAGLLAACGGEEPATDTLLRQPEDTTKQAKRGGIMKDRVRAEPPTLDPFTPNRPWDGLGPHVYSALVDFKPGGEVGEMVGNLAESWEWSQDGLQITLKLRPGVKFHNKPPVNGRAVDAEDLRFSWDRFSTKSTGRDGVLNEFNPSAPILSLTAIDSRTIVVKLKEPVVYALGLLANTSSGSVLVLPKETDSTFDIRGDMIGTGPWLLERHQPSVGFTLRRHPEHWDKDWALIEQIEKPIISEYAAVLGQFKAGNIYTFGSHESINQEDVLPTKQDQPETLIYSRGRGGGGIVLSGGFGWLPEGKSPFLDERVRQAVSMSFDRDLYIEVFNNVSQFEAAGLPMDTYWHTALGAGAAGFWLDPQGKDFGPNAKYFKHDLAEAKKLLAAAGYPDGFEATSHYETRGLVGDPKANEVKDGMIQELGIRIRVKPIDYSTEYIPLYRDGKGQFEGWAYMSAAAVIDGGHPLGGLAALYWSKSGSPGFRGFSLSGKNDLSGDPQLDAMIEKARIDLDPDRQRALVFDIQRYLAKAQYCLPELGGAATFTVAWPCVRNFQVYQVPVKGNAWQNYRLWIDETKPPLSG